MAQAIGEIDRAPSIFHGVSPAVLILASIVIIGATFRFMELGAIRHGYDEGYPAYDALRLLDGGEILLTGQPSSVFLDNPPLMAFLQSIPLYFWRSLWSVYIFVTTLNTIAIWFVYQATRKLLGQNAALLAAFLFAINPWVVQFSRAPWVQGLLPLFTTVIAWGLWPVIVTRTDAPRNVFIAMLAVTAMTQTYILGLGILLPVALLSLVFFRHIPKRAFYAGIFILIFGMILFGASLFLKEDRNTTKFQEFFSDNTFMIRTQAIEHAVRFVTGLDSEGPDLATEEALRRKALSRGAHALLSLVLLAGGIRALLALRHDNKERRLAIVLLVWFFAPVLALLFLPYLVHPHYLLLSLPAGHVLAAWGAMPLFTRRRWRLVAVAGLVATAGVFWLNLQVQRQMVLSNPSGYGFNDWALADISGIGETIRELSTDNSYPRRIFAEDNSPLLSSISATYVETMPELEFADFLLLPGQEPFLYVLINQAPVSPLLGPHQESFPERTIQVADGASVSFLRISPYDRDQALALPRTIVDWTSDAGLTLLGYSLETPPPYRAGNPLVVTAYWRVEELHPDRATWLVSPFVHVLNPEWQIVANESSHGQSGDRWWIGDVYVHRTTITLPDYLEPGEHQLVLGLFDPAQRTRFFLNAPSGSEPMYSVPLHIDE